MEKINLKNIKWGDVVEVDLGTNEGSVQSGTRPAIIIQNDMGNQYAPTTIIIPLTKGSNNKKPIPTHYLLQKENYSFLKEDSIVICEQIQTISKTQIFKCLGKVNKKDLSEIFSKISISLGVTNIGTLKA